MHTLHLQFKWSISFYYAVHGIYSYCCFFFIGFICFTWVLTVDWNEMVMNVVDGGSSCDGCGVDDDDGGDVCWRAWVCFFFFQKISIATNKYTTKNRSNDASAIKKNNTTQRSYKSYKWKVHNIHFITYLWSIMLHMYRNSIYFIKKEVFFSHIEYYFLFLLLLLRKEWKQKKKNKNVNAISIRSFKNFNFNYLYLCISIYVYIAFDSCCCFYWCCFCFGTQT